MHIYNGILLSHKKNAVLPFVTTWMDLEGTVLNEMNHTEKQIPYDFTYMWTLTKQKNK